MDNQELYESIYQKPSDVLGNPNKMALMVSGDYSSNTLDFIYVYYKVFLPYQDEKHKKFKQVLDDLFINPKFNTKTKKSTLYKYLEDNFIEVEKLTKYDALSVVSEIEKNNSNFINDDKEIYVYRGYTPFVEVVLPNMIGHKTICKYRHLLPKQTRKDFKEKYPHLYKAIQGSEVFASNRMAEEKYIQIHNNEGISDIIKHLGLNKITDEKAEDFKKYGKMDMTYTTPKGNVFKYDLDSNEGSSILQISNVMNNLGKSQQALLIVYIMSLVFEKSNNGNIESNANITIDIKKYCELRNLDYRTDMINSIREDIKNLQNIIVNYKYKSGKKELHLYDTPLVTLRGNLDVKDNINNTERQFIKVSVGAWIETLNYKQFQHISNDFFRYDLRKVNEAIIPISYYINTQHRNNLKKSKKQIGLKVSNLTSKLGVNEDRVKAKGYSSTLKTPLQKILDEIQKTEGFIWSYKNGNHSSRLEFENDVIMFENTDLDSHYDLVGYEKKETKKPKTKK